MLASMSGSDARADTLNWSDLGVSELPTGTVTLLLADIEGSTRLWESDPDAMTGAVARLDSALTDLVASHSGVRPVEQGEGDSFVVAFARATDAVACALRLQQAPLAPIRLRIGVHTGEVRLRDEGNYIGPTINRTARLRDLAHGGQTVLSGVTEELAFEQLPDGAWLSDLGTHQLRDVSRAERVAQLCHPDLRNEFPPLRVAKSGAPQRLPMQFTSFVGREAEMAEVRELLAEHRLVTLTGDGGAGKTRLAIEIAGQVLHEFGDGVWYVDLAPITHPDLVPLTVARTLGLPDQMGSSTLDMIIRIIGDRSMLILLDNCEHLTDASAALTAGLLGACPALSFLTTSREPIRAVGEITWQVPSLSVEDEAVELFADRARQVRQSFSVTVDNEAAVTEICHRLDGMPLAIELAAARTRALSPAEIVNSLHDRFRLLTGGARTAVRRQQTLRASVDWSHALLSEPEQALFRQLAVFLGGFDLGGAQAAAGDDVEHYQVFDTLTLLVDKSLVIADEGGTRTRYRLLETMRQYALEKLGESGEADRVRMRHRDYYLELAATLDVPAVSGHDQLLDNLESDIDNLRAAYVWSVESGDTQDAMKLASSLLPMWLSRGRIQEGLAWFETALPKDLATCVDIEPAVHARVIADKVVLQSWTNNYQLIDAEQGLTIARELGDPALLARSLLACGSAAIYDFEIADRYLTEALGLARGLGDRWRLSQILCQQAQAALVAGEVRTLREAAAEGCDIASQIGDRFGLLQSRWRLASAYMVCGDLSSAVAELRESAADAHEHHDVVSEVTALIILPQALAYQGDVEGARTAAETAIRSAADLGDVFVGAGYIGLMIANLAGGDVPKAERAADAAWTRMGELYGTASINTAYVAQACLARGDLIGARRRANDAIAGTSGWPLAVALTARARVGLAEGDFAGAQRDAHDALACRAESGSYLDVPDVIEVLAQVMSSTRRHHEAARLFGAADGIRQRTGEVRFAIYQAGYLASVEATRDSLKDNDFQRAWSEGVSLSTEEALAYAQRGRGGRKRPADGWASLTPTEHDVVRLVAEGLANKDIATRLFISPRTVESHLTHVYAKLGLSSRVHLAQEAVRHEHGS